MYYCVCIGVRMEDKMCIISSRLKWVALKVLAVQGLSCLVAIHSWRVRNKRGVDKD